jgi:hypothetical protein
MSCYLEVSLISELEKNKIFVLYNALKLCDINMNKTKFMGRTSVRSPYGKLSNNKGKL